MMESIYQDLLIARTDPRTKSWLLVESPWPVILILSGYVIFCLYCKQLMKHFPALQLRPVLVVYNLALVVLSVYIAYEYAVTAFLSSYSLVCQPVDYSNNALSIRMASVTWWFFLSKIIELLDTFFFDHRKKFTQVSFLHAYHHTTALFYCWVGVKYVAASDFFFPSMLNAFVHAFMYCYYGLSAIGPHVQKYLWWKRHLTTLQITQLVVDFIHCSYALYVGCHFPKFFLWRAFVFQLSLILLFVGFYRKRYSAKTE